MREELERSLELAQRQSADGDAENVALKARAEEFEHGLQQAQRQKRDAQAESVALKARLEELGKTLEFADRKARAENDQKMSWKAQAEALQNDLDTARKQHSVEKFAGDTHAEELEKALEEAKCEKSDCDKAKSEIKGRVEELECELAETKQRHMDKEEQNLALITQREADEKQAFVAKAEELLETVSLAQALKDRSEDAEQRNRSMEAMQEAQQRRCRNHESELDAQHRRIQDLQALLDRAHVTVEGFARKHSSTELQLAEIEKQWSETMSMKNRYIGSLEQILNSPNDSRDEAQPGTGSARKGSAPAVQLHVRDEDEPPLASRGRSQYYSIFGQGTGVSSAELRAAVANLPIAKPAAMASSSSPPPAARSPQSSDEGVGDSVQPAGEENEDGDQLQAAVTASGDEDSPLGRPTPWTAPPPQAADDA